MNSNLADITDYDLNGGFDSAGNIKIVIGDKAVTNAILIWLSSSDNDFPRYSGRGGFLVRWLMKPMSDNRADDIETSIKTGVKRDFDPPLILTQLNITPDYEKKRWLIYMEGYSPAYKENFSLSTAIKNLG